MFPMVWPQALFSPSVSEVDIYRAYVTLCYTLRPVDQLIVSSRVLNSKHWNECIGMHLNAFPCI